MRFKVIARKVLAASVLGSVLLGTGVRAPAWGDPPQLRAHLAVSPTSGPAGTAVQLEGSGYVPNLKVTVSFMDASGSRELFWIWADSNGSFKAGACVPRDASQGADYFVAKSPQNRASGLAMFEVYPAAASSNGICI